MRPTLVCLNVAGDAQSVDILSRRRRHTSSLIVSLESTTCPIRRTRGIACVRWLVGPEANAIGALAFTRGSNMYFAPGQYDPHSPGGQRRLGHELTHVLQQRAGRVRNPFGAGVAVVQDRVLEAEADRMGQRAAAHRADARGTTAGAVQPSSARRIGAPITGRSDGMRRVGATCASWQRRSPRAPGTPRGAIQPMRRDKTEQSHNYIVPEQPGWYRRTSHNVSAL